MNEQELVKEVFARLLKGHYLPIHICSMCQYQCGYRVVNKILVYDSGCACYATEKSPRQLVELVNYITENTDYIRQWMNCTLINKEDVLQWLH